MSFDDQKKEHEERKRRAMEMGGAEKLERRRNAGLLNARERIDYLFDPGSFRESGLFGVSYIPEMRDQTPADGKVTSVRFRPGDQVQEGEVLVVVEETG